MKKNNVFLIVLLALAGTAVTALCVHILREKQVQQNPPAAEYSADEQTAQDRPDEEGEDLFSVLGDMIRKEEPEPDPFIPTAELDTEHYPMFTEAGLDTMVTRNPLHANGDNYAMLWDSESVILSEPVTLREMPHGGAVTLWFAYDKAEAEPFLSRMQIMRYDCDAPNSAHQNEFEPLSGSVIDGEKQRISITVTEPGVYYVFDADAWARLWGNQTGSPLIYRNPAVGFTFEVPSEIIVNQLMMDFDRIDEQYIPPEKRWTDDRGARHVKPLQFSPSNSDPDIYDFSLEWITDCHGADTAECEQLDAFDEINQLRDVTVSIEVLLEQTRELPDGSHCRVLVAQTLDKENGNRPCGKCIRAYFDLKPNEIIYVEYSINPDAPESLYETLLYSLDTFRRTGIVPEEP